MTFPWQGLLPNPAMREVPWSNIEVEEEWMPGHYGPSQVYYIEGNRFVIGAGSRDDVTVFTDGETYWFLVENGGIGYVGLEVHDTDDQGEEGEPGNTEVGAVFFQEHWEIEQVSEDWDELTDKQKIDLLQEYIYFY